MERELSIEECRALQYILNISKKKNEHIPQLSKTHAGRCVFWTTLSVLRLCAYPCSLVPIFDIPALVSPSAVLSVKSTSGSRARL